MSHPTQGNPPDPNQRSDHQHSGFVPPGYQQPGYQQPGYQQSEYPTQPHWYPGAVPPGSAYPGHPMAQQPQAWDAGPPGGTGGPPRGGGSGKALAVIAAGVILIVVVAVAAVVLVVRSTHDDHDTSASAAQSSSVLPSTTTPTPSGSPSTTAPAAAQCPPATAAPDTPAGWRTVAGKRGLAYDVPPNWTVASCGTLVGWEKRCNDGPFGYCAIRTMSGAATLDAPGCGDNSVGVSGLPGASNTTDINEAVRDEAALVADIYTSDSGHVPTVQLSPPRQLTVGGAPAVQVVASVSNIATSNCVGPTAIHSMVATTVPGQQGCVLFVISAPQGVPDAVSPAVVTEMVSTLRRAS
ncbi:hypothetical protein [Gordonia sp. N1V]|uniref:hypothetical protein n=1 Tax=Gordonia sp. N1V TaxID=3034163 RepID=UPI0023E2A627|nr:hypothetical protein [Gordonia sp. N1V]MDF3284735.1 hypothetical protein [Gordonia sp. N1V]